MNWEAIGAIAELLGGIGVIASLVYLATQIRQSREQMSASTRAIQGATNQQFERDVYDIILRDLTVPGLQQAIDQGMRDFDSLIDEDRFRFIRWAVVRMRAWDNAYYQFRMGMLDEERWAISRRDLALFLRGPGVVQWWQAHPSTLSPEFVALVEEILNHQPEAASSETGR
jgi:hypothetical protein